MHQVKSIGEYKIQIGLFTISQRFAIFCSNLDLIAEQNAKHNPKTYFAVNQFADLSKEEFRRFTTDFVPHKKIVQRAPADSHKIQDRTGSSLRTNF